MSLWSRIANVFHGDRLNGEIDEEQDSHIEEALAQGRDPAEARRAFGSTLQRREESHELRVLPWLDSLRADAIFGWRQLWKRKVTTAAAILSLALATGACTSAFRLIDAVLLRPLPVAHSDRLYELARQGNDPFGTKTITFDGWAYPSFLRMRAAAKGQAELMAVSYATRMDLTYRSDQEMEKAYLQYVSGWMFESFGLRPSLGRLLTENDDQKAGAQPYAVLSHDYWERRFGQDPGVIGRTFRMGDQLFEIIGVTSGPFTGTETGTVTDIFVPTMMHPCAVHDDCTWHRSLALVQPGVAIEPLRQKLDATSRAFEEQRAKGFTGMTEESIAKFLAQKVVLEPAAAGASGLQADYRRALMALGVLVALVLLIACANVANLMTAQAAARAREMALRVSIGAGRWRLIQLVLVESAMLAGSASLIGAVFAWWSAPIVVSRINPPDNPAHLSLPADWRVLIFSLSLSVVVMLLFGLMPALRASAVKPASALKGGADPHSRHRMMQALIAAQVAFCFLVLFVAGLFAATFERLSNRPLGFSAERLLAIETVAQRPQSPDFWEQAAEHLRSVPGVEKVALAGFPLLAGSSWNGVVSVNGGPPGPVLAYFLQVSPDWMAAMKIPFTSGRDFRKSDTSPGMAMVNDSFAKQYFNGGSPLGQYFAKGTDVYRVVGVVHDAPYRNVREPTLPVAYVPFRRKDETGAVMRVREATFMVRTTSLNRLSMASMLRGEVPRARSEFRVSNIRTQAELVNAQTVRERLLALLASFFGAVALLLAGVGLYGVLDYSVLQRRREIGIRMAIGARPASIAQLVTVETFSMVLLGAAAGLALGMGCGRYLESLLYEVKPTEAAILVLPALTILAAALLSAVPAVIRAIRIDPVAMLRSE